MRRQFPGLDGIRAVGALLVLGTHVGFESGASISSSFNGVLSRMDSGVAIFFVISGFLLYRPHAVCLLTGDPRPDVRRYFWHRAVRILPPLWLAVLGAAIVFHGRPGTTARNLALHSALVQIYVERHEALGLTQMWSLATEAAFYVLLPVLAWVLARRMPHPVVGAPDTRAAVRVRLGLLLALPVVGSAWMALAADRHEPLWGIWLPGYIGWFGLGMALSLWSAARSLGVLGHTWLDDLAPRSWTVWGVAVGLYLVLVSPVAGPYDLSPATPGQAATKNLLYGILGALVVLPAVSARTSEEDPPEARALGGRVGKVLGDLSYGVFCYHLIVLGLVERAIGFQIFTGRFWTLLGLTAPLSLLVAAASFYGVERPLMRRARRGERVPAHVTESASATAVSTAS
ncbi:acyltransferase family protein [Pedococcus sp. NPDC057267]|uniref:acyltransferase family protein n=1 Tax=Pedococcus sp. NPDC057267 TaxID=3346077 RepID=UPI00363B56B6